ncbi:MAG: hypothetical protein IPP51_01340 [Bacteroidetes bacterium]|nr:hypothetical protein [Bacteroidota bacterium]
MAASPSFINAMLRSQNFIFLALAVFLLLVMPLLSIADKSAFVAGIPVLYVYIAGVWLIAILFTYLISLNRKRKRNHER